MNHQIKVVLNISALSVPNKINRSQDVLTSIASNPAVFTNLGTVLSDASSAVNALQAAALDAVNGGKSKTALLHDREAELLKAMNRVAAYVEGIANGDPAIVHLAGLGVKKPSSRTAQGFEVHQASAGAVSVSVKPQAKTIYKWQYCKDPQANAWTELYSDVSKVIINNLQTGIYWFRVIFITGAGELQGGTVSFAVN